MPEYTTEYVEDLLHIYEEHRKLQLKTLDRIKETEEVLAQLRHAYLQLIEGVVIDQTSFAEGLIAPQIKILEKMWNV